LRTGLLYPDSIACAQAGLLDPKRPTPLHQSSLQRSGPKVNEGLKKWPLIGRRYVCKHAATEFVKAQVRVRWTPRQGIELRVCEFKFVEGNQISFQSCNTERAMHNQDCRGAWLVAATFIISSFLTLSSAAQVTKPWEFPSELRPELESRLHLFMQAQAEGRWDEVALFLGQHRRGSRPA
jgi:hypothetical protein